MRGLAMTDALVERHFSQPVTEAGMQAAAANAGCMGVHRVQWLGSLLSSDGMDMFCHFRGLDAESVRIAMHQAGARPGHVWACSFRDAPGMTAADLAAVNVLVAHVADEPDAFGGCEWHGDLPVGCFGIHQVRLVRSYVSADRRRTVSLYQAPDAESVRLAHRAAGLPADKVWLVRHYAP
jgi:hypothetical protein